MIVEAVAAPLTQPALMPAASPTCAKVENVPPLSDDNAWRDGNPAVCSVLLKGTHDWIAQKVLLERQKRD